MRSTFFCRGGEEVFLLVRNTHVGDRDRKTRQGGKSEADFFHLVEQFDGGGLAQTLKRIGNHLAATLLSEGAVVIRHAWAQTFAEQGSPHRGSDARLSGSGEAVPNCLSTTSSYRSKRMSMG